MFCLVLKNTVGTSCTNLGYPRFNEWMHICINSVMTNGKVTLGLYVDDILMIGNQDDIDEIVIKIERNFDIRINEDIEEFIGCQFKWDYDKKSVILHQLRLINKIEDEFGVFLASTRLHDSPALEGQNVYHVK